MPAKNLSLDEDISAAAKEYAAQNPKHRSLSRLVQHLLIRELRANLPKVRKICRAKGVPLPEIFTK